MKVLALKAYVVLMLGVPPACRHFVDAIIGLKVYIHPKIVSNKGHLLLESIELSEKYTVSIASCTSMLRNVVAKKLMKPKPQKNPFSKLKDFFLTSRYGRSSLTQFEGESSTSLLRNSDSTDEDMREISEDTNDMWELPYDSTVVSVGSASYTAHWNMDGESLKRWFQKELLYASRSKIMMNAQAYAKRHRGVYTYEWTAKKGYVFNLGRPEVTLVNPVEIEQDELLGVIFAESMGQRNVRIDFDIEAIRIPSSNYATVQSTLSDQNIHTVRDGNGRVHFKGKCSDFDSLQKRSTSRSIMTLRLSKGTSRRHFQIDPNAYTIITDGICTVPIEASGDETIILGTPLLKAYSVIFENTRDKLIFFLLPKE